MRCIRRIQIRRGTSSEWSSANPVLLAGELGYETDTGRLKIGNGSTSWNDLPYFEPGSSGGASTFLDLTDTPSSYSGQAGKIVKVNSSEDGLEFGDPPPSADEKVKADSGDPTAGFLSDKVDGTTLEVDTALHQLKVKDGVFAPASHSHTSSDISDFESAVRTIIQASSIKDLSDVDSAMAPSAGQVLGWDGSKWTATTVSGGGGGGTPGGTDGAVQFNDAGSFGGDASNFHWDNGNKRLGIKTANPQRDVHVWAEGGGPAAFRLSRGDVDHSAVFEFDTNNTANVTDPRYFMGIPYSTRYFSISRYNGSVQTDFVIKEDGKIGLGTDNPTELVQVGNPGDGSRAIANEWAVFSDERFKEIRGSYDKGLSVLENLKVVRYYPRRSGDGIERIGITAQGLMDAGGKEAVRDTGGYLSIDLNALVGILINAIKELAARVKQLEQREGGA